MLLGLGFCDFFFLISQPLFFGFCLLSFLCWHLSALLILKCVFFWGGDEFVCRQEAAGVIDPLFHRRWGKAQGGFERAMGGFWSLFDF